MRGSIQKILVPVDFSPQSASALSVAVAIAKRAKAGLVLLHVLDVPYLSAKDNALLADWLTASEPGPAQPQPGPYLAEVASIAQKKLRELRLMCGKLPVQEKIWVAQVAKYISSFAAEQAADLIVMGTRGSTQDDDLLVGSNTEAVIRTAACPVLSVKEPLAGDGFGRICLASDFLEVSDRLVEFVRVFQGLFGAHLYLLKVITPANFEIGPVTLQTLRDFAAEHGLENWSAHFFNHLSEHEGILAFGQEVGADLVALGTYGNSGLLHLLMGSVAEDVVNHADRPVLTYNQYLD
jgi:nucleotide-binding universal stress UspA family protein